MGVGSFVGKIKVVVVVSSADAKQSYDDLDGFMDPRGAHSVEAAIDADNTWGGKVDDGRLVSIDNVGPPQALGLDLPRRGLPPQIPEANGGIGEGYTASTWRVTVYAMESGGEKGYWCTLPNVIA